MSNHSQLPPELYAQDPPPLSGAALGDTVYISPSAIQTDDDGYLWVYAGAMAYSKSSQKAPLAVTVTQFGVSVSYDDLAQFRYRARGASHEAMRRSHRLGSVQKVEITNAG